MILKSTISLRSRYYKSGKTRKISTPSKPCPERLVDTAAMKSMDNPDCITIYEEMAEWIQEKLNKLLQQE